jgi:hypothetical protein
MSCDQENIIQMEKIHVEDKDEEDEDDKQMTATIDQAQENIRPILRILQNACIHDAKGSKIRQMEYSVNQFIQEYPHITAQNFYEKEFDLSNKIREARCFFMFLQQLQPRTSRQVNPRNIQKPLMMLLAYMYIGWL